MPGLRATRERLARPLVGESVFPQGIFTFTLLSPEEVSDQPLSRTRATPDFMHDGNQLFHDDGEQMTIFLGKAQQQEPGGEDAGDRIFFLNLVTRDGPVEIEQVDLDNGTYGWQFANSADLYLKLASALGAMTVDEDGYHVPASNLRQLLENGSFDGQQIVAEVRHRKGKGASAGRKFPFVRNIFAVNPGIIRTGG